MATTPMGFNPTSLIAPDLQTELLANQRRQQLAQMLREQAIQPEQTQEVSGRVVPYGIGQGMTKLAQALMARRAQSSADAQMADLNKEYAARYASALARTVPGSQDNVLSTGQLNPDGSNPGTVGPTIQNAAQVDPASSNLADAARAAAMMGNTDLADKLTVQAWQQQAPTDQVKTYRQLGVPMDLAKAATERELQSKGLSNTAQLIQELNDAPPGERDAYAMALGLKPNAEQNLQNAQRNREIALQERNQYWETGMGPQGQASPMTPAGMPSPNVAGMTPKDRAAYTAKITQERPMATASLQNTYDSLDRLKAFAQQIANDKNLYKITGAYGALPNIPGSEASDLSAKVNAMTGQIALNAMQSLKQLSSNGATGFGQLSNKEGEMLQNSIGALDRKQSPEAFKKQIQAIVDYVDAAKQRMADAYKLTYGAEPPAKTAPVNNRSIIRTGMHNGRKVVQYSDGTIDYADQSQ